MLISPAFCRALDPCSNHPTITSITPDVWFAGQTYHNVTITGTNLNSYVGLEGTNCPVEIQVNMDTGSGSLDVNSQSSTQIMAKVKPDRSDPTETACVTAAVFFPLVVRAAESANVTPAAGTAGSPCTDPDGNQGITVAILGAPKIMWSGKRISVTGDANPTPQPAVVGQQIKLITKPKAEELVALGVSSPMYTWTVDGTRIADYAPTVASAKVKKLTDADLKKANITFYWVYPENDNIPVTYKYCVDIPGADADGQCSLVANAAFTVDGPSDVSVIPSDMTFFVSGNPESMIWSIEFDATATSPPSNDGEYTWVQLITVKEIGDFDDGTGSTCTGGPGLDTQYPYETGLHSEDGFVDPIDSTYEKKEKTNSDFHMYLMWNPLTDGSIPVPLGSIAWSASGEVVWNSASKTWKKTSGSGGTKSDDFSTQSPSFPQWTGGPVTPATIAANCK